MESHSAYTDSEFIQLFQNCELSPSIFTHEAHLRLAWIHITLYGVQRAEENIVSQLLSFVAHVGAKDKFNHTLTIASIRIMAQLISESSAANFDSFIAQFPQLKTDFKGMINTHYGFDIFTSKRAKSEFMEPDLRPFGS